MALLTTQNIARGAPLTPTYTAVSASDTFVPGANTFVHIKNGGGSTDNIGIQVLQGNPSGLTIANIGPGIAAGNERLIGPLPASFFADPTTGLGTITHSFTTSVTIAVFNLLLP